MVRIFIVQNQIKVEGKKSFDKISDTKSNYALGEKNLYNTAN